VETQINDKESFFMRVKSTLLAIAVTMISILSLPIPAYAQSPVSVQSVNSTVGGFERYAVTPRFSETSFAAAIISQSDTTIYPEISVQAIKASCIISGTLYLERYVRGSWRGVTSWRVSGTGSINSCKSYNGTAGTTYRARFVVTVGSERVERSSVSCRT
jgi:hypothetical protein